MNDYMLGFWARVNGNNDPIEDTDDEDTFTPEYEDDQTEE